MHLNRTALGAAGVLKRCFGIVTLTMGLAAIGAGAMAQNTVYNWNPTPGGILSTSGSQLSYLQVVRNYMQYVSADPTKPNINVNAVTFRSGSVVATLPITSVKYDTVLVRTAAYPHAHVTADGFVGGNAIHLSADIWETTSYNTGSARFTLSRASTPTIAFYDSGMMFAGQAYIKPE